MVRIEKNMNKSQTENRTGVKEREIWLDILKATAVSAVSFFHAGFPTFFLPMIILSAFIVASGYVFKEQKLIDYLKKQFFRLWIPFVVANFLAVLLRNLLISVGLWAGYPYKGKAVFMSVLRSFVFCFSDDLCSPHWFVFMIFTVGVFFYFLYYLCVFTERFLLGLKKGKTVENSIREGLVRDVLICVISVLMFIAGIVFNGPLNKFMWNNCAFVTNIFYATILYSLGYISKRYALIKKILNLNLWVKIGVFILLSIVLSVLYLKGYIVDHRAGRFSNPILVPGVAYMGFLWLMFVSKAVIEKLPTVVKSFICYIGRNSLYIMLYHAMAYQVVTFIQVKICHIPYDPAWQWQNVYMGNGMWVTLAGLCGVIIPLAVPKLKSIIAKRFRKDGLSK